MRPRRLEYKRILTPFTPTWSISPIVMNGRVSEDVSTDLSGNENRLFLLTSIWRICRYTLKFMICLESVPSLNGSDRDPHKDSRDLSLEGGQAAEVKPWKDSLRFCPGGPEKLEIGTCPGARYVACQLRILFPVN